MKSLMSPEVTQIFRPQESQDPAVRACQSIPSDPFHETSVRALTERGLLGVELAVMQARVDASAACVVDLFCLLAQHSPELFPEPWAAVADVIAAEERFWVYPKATVGEVEDGCSEAFTPYLDRRKLGAEWHRLLEHARRVHDCRQSAAAHGYQG